MGRGPLAIQVSSLPCHPGTLADRLSTIRSVPNHQVSAQLSGCRLDIAFPA